MDVCTRCLYEPRELATWKRKVRAGWARVALRAVELPSKNLPFAPAIFDIAYQ